MSEQKIQSHIFKGFVIAVIYIIFNSIITFSKLGNTSWTDFVAWLIIIIGASASVHLFAKQNNFNQPFTALFSHGFKTAAVVTCLLFIYVLIMVYVVDKERVATMVAKSIEEARKNNNVIDEKQIAANMPSAIKIARMMLIAGTIMGTLLLGIVGSAIGAVGTSKQNVQKN